MSLIECEATGREVAPGRDPFLALAAVHDSLDELDGANLTQLDGGWLAHLVRATDRLATRSLAAAVTVADEVERRGHGRESGFFATKAYLRHHGLLPGPEALMRTKISRLFDLVPMWSSAAHAGDVGVDQVRLMALVGSNPRIQDALVDGGSDELLVDAQWAPYDLFEERVRNFARVADPEGASDTAQRRGEERDVRMRRRPDGSWRLSGTFGSLQGAQINDVLAHFNQASSRRIGPRPSSLEVPVRRRFAAELPAAPTRIRNVQVPLGRRKQPAQRSCPTSLDVLERAPSQGMARALTGSVRQLRNYRAIRTVPTP